MIGEIQDPVLYREALRLATESLGVSPDVLMKEEPANARARAPRSRGPADPHTEAGDAVLTLVLTRPDLTAPLLKEGLKIQALHEPLTLLEEDFRDETQARIFTLLREHAGADLDAVLVDERARPLMDRIGALASQGERLFPSEGSVRAGLATARDTEPRTEQAGDTRLRPEGTAPGGDPTPQTRPALRLLRSLKPRATNRIIASAAFPCSSIGRAFGC